MQIKSSTTVEATENYKEPLSVSGNTVTVKIDGEQTDNAYSVFELSVPPEVGAGLHIDKDWDEWWHVMEGTFAFTLNGERIELGAGGFAHGSKGIPHSFKNVGDTPGKLVMVTMPSGLENFFRNIDNASTKRQIDKETFVKIMQAHQTEPA